MKQKLITEIGPLPGNYRLAATDEQTTKQTDRMA